MGVAPGTKTVKKSSSPKTSNSSPSHPPYIQMITEALVALKERTGSSHYAIVKHIEEEQKIKNLPANFKKILSVQLKKFVASGKLIMVKKSFKLPAKTSATTTKSTAPPAAAKKSKTVEKKVTKKAAAATKVATTASKPKDVAKKSGKKGESKSLKVVKSPMKKKASAVVAKAKKPKSIKSPVKKAAAAAATKAKK